MFFRERTRRISIISVLFFMWLLFYGCGGGKQEATQTVNVNTSATNTAPVISSVVASPGTTQTSGAVTITCTATDADGDTLSYGWSVTGGTLQSSSGKQVTWTAPDTAGNYTISVLVTDGKGGQASSTVTVSITSPQNANKNPVIGSGPTANPSTLKTGLQSTISVSASDLDGDTLSYSWSASCGTYTGSGASILFTAPSSASTCTVSVVVSDGKGGTAGGSADIPVSAFNSTNFVYSTQWGQKGTCGTNQGCGDTDLYQPLGIGLDKDGNVYVTNSLNEGKGCGYYENFVKKFSATGNFLKIYGIKGTCVTDKGCYPSTSVEGGFSAPMDVAIDSSTGNVFVLEVLGQRVQKLDSEGAFQRTWTTTALSSWPHIVLDNEKYIWVIRNEASGCYQYFQSNVYKYDEIGNFKASGTIEYACTLSVLAVDSSSNVYVAINDANYSGGKIVVFDKNGNRLRSWGSLGINPEQFTTPAGVAVDSADRVYVVDSGANLNSVKVFSSDGTFITSFGKKGTGNGEFTSPTDIAVSASGLVYVVDSGNNRIQVFSPQ